MAYESYESFESVKERLDQIVEAVSDEELPLDEALSLYEEAVGLGLRASDLLEEGIDEKAAAEALAASDAADSASGPASDAADAAPADEGAPQAETSPSAADD
jgi:exodeoxyribonuclease VII small subunit